MKDKSTKDIIIEILSEEWPLSARIVWNKMKKDYLKNNSYQACYKVIQKMLKDEIIIKKENKYSLNESWIKKSKDHFNILDKNYRNKRIEKVPYSKSHIKDYVKYSFKTLKGLGNYLANYFFKFPNPDKKPIIFNWYGVYSIFGIPKEDLNTVKEAINKNKGYILCESHTFYDKFMIKLYSSFTKRLYTKLKIKCTEGCDYLIIGDYLARIYFSPKIIEISDKIKKDMRYFLNSEFNIILNTMHEEFDPPNYIIIEKNPEIAEKIRNKTLAYFKK